MMGVCPGRRLMGVVGRTGEVTQGKQCLMQ